MEWRYFESVEPSGDRRLDLLFAALMMTIVNVNASKKSHKRKLQDFMPTWWKNVGNAKSPEDLLTTIEGIVKQFNGKVKK